MKATPVLDYTVPESVQTLQEKIHADDGGGNTCTCANDSSMTNPPPCKCGCGAGYSTFL
jgi:hypothetical protein